MRGSSLLSRSPVDALRDLESKLAKRQRDLGGHDAAKPADTDLEAMDAWEARRVPLEMLLRTAERAVAAQRPLAEEWQAKQARAALEDEARAMLRENRAGARRLVTDFPKVVAPVVAMVQATAENAQATADLNARLKAAGLPPIETVEELARKSEGRTIPARIRMEKLWINPATGERCAGFVRDPATGELVPQNPGPYRLTEVEVVEQRERQEPARMPKRLADAVVLPGVRHGDAMAWPPKDVTR